MLRTEVGDTVMERRVRKTTPHETRRTLPKPATLPSEDTNNTANQTTDLHTIDNGCTMVVLRAVLNHLQIVSNNHNLYLTGLEPTAATILLRAMIYRWDIGSWTSGIEDGRGKTSLDDSGRGKRYEALPRRSKNLSDPRLKVIP